MPAFSYSAVNTRGEKTKGYLIAENERQAMSALKSKRLYPIKISKELTAGYFGANGDWAIEWARDMAFFLDKGLSLRESLEIGKIGLDRAKRRLIDEVTASVHGGYPLSAALRERKKFPDLLISFLTVGEASGQYAQAFRDFATISAERKKFTEDLWESLRYPLVLLGVTLITLVGFSEFLLPAFLEFFRQNDFTINPTTEAFIEFSKIIKLGLELSLNPLTATICLALYATRFVFAPVRILFSRLATRIPLFGGIYSRLLQHLYLKTFAKLLARGHHLDQALIHAAAIIPNEYLKARALKTIDAIAKDGRVARAIGQCLELRRVYVSLLEIGEETGGIAAYSEICSDTIQRNFKSSLRKILTWTGPILITTIGIMIIFTVVSVVLPLYEQIVNLG